MILLVKGLTKDKVAERLEDRAILVETVEACLTYQKEGMSAAKEDVDKEEDEVLLGVVADTVIDPRAVMVHSCYASLADGAVVRVGRLD